MKSIVLMAMSCVVLSAWCLTPQEKAQYKRMSAKYTAEPNDFFSRKVKTATILVKCHPSDLITGIGSQGTGGNQPFACTALEGKNEKMFFAYAQKSSRLCKDLVKYCTEKVPDGDVECYVTVEKLAFDRLFVDGAFETVDGCWIKEFMPKEKYVVTEEPQKGKESVPVEPEVSSSISIAMFKADKAAKPVKYYAKAKLGTSYNYDFLDCEKTHWSVDLRCRDACGNKEYIQGYALKSSEVGAAVKKILEDGRRHEVEVVLSHPNNADSGSCCNIVSCVEVAPAK